MLLESGIFKRTSPVIESILARTSDIADDVLQKASAVQGNKTVLRKKIARNGLIHPVPAVNAEKTPFIEGVDGAFIFERTAFVDIACACGVRTGSAVESRTWMDVFGHDAAGDVFSQCVMRTMEIELAAGRQEVITLMDGSFASFVIDIKQELAVAVESRSDMAAFLLDLWGHDMAEKLLSVLAGDTPVLAIPKFTTRNEFLRFDDLDIPRWMDGKTVASTVLNAGEFMGPFPMTTGQDPKSWRVTHLHAIPASMDIIDAIEMAFSEMDVYYIKPMDGVPAVRIETPKKLSNLVPEWLSAISQQFLSPAVMEPLSLYLADQFAKEISQAFEASKASLELMILRHSLPEQPFLKNHRSAS